MFDFHVTTSSQRSVSKTVDSFKNRVDDVDSKDSGGVQVLGGAHKTVLNSNNDGVYKTVLNSNGVNHNLRLLVWNINGLSSEKIKILHANLDQDMIAFQETWNTNERILELDGYNALHCIRSSLDPNALRGAGGISVFIKNYLKSNVTVLKKCDDSILWLKIKEETIGNSYPIALAIVYFPPEG